MDLVTVMKNIQKYVYTFQIRTVDFFQVLEFPVNFYVR